MIGQVLAHYEILAKIGEGGMGEVYRARDSRLRRMVAIKVLPPALADDPERLARLEQEARTLASLNHPNIATIHGIEEHGDLRYLVMEFAEGEDLASRLLPGAIPVTAALDLARQIAVGLEEAHSRGVVHRDLKPANIRISDDGHAKLLDFGLAKAIAEEESQPSGGTETPTVAQGLTQEGLVLGTPAYMSPEQARGLTVDRRTDIWSFGCVLYEMLTGLPPFRGDTVSDCIAAVLDRDPDWTRLPADTPPAVSRLLRRCLAKDPKQRIHHVADVRLELEESRADPGTGPPEPPPKAMPRFPRGLHLALFAAAVVAVLAVGGLLVDRLEWFGSGAGPVPRTDYFTGASFTKLTDWPGDELNAALSPDGGFVTFLAERGATFDMMVGQVDSRDFRNLTANTNEPFGADVRGPVRCIGFNGDGSRIWFGGGTGRVRTVPLFGGPAQNFLGEDVVSVDWSPDGDRLVYHLGTSGDPVFVADRDGTGPALILESPAGHHQHFPTWSPDGEWIYLMRGRPRVGDTALWRLRPDGTELTRLTTEQRHVTYPTPIDARTVLFCAQDRNGAGPWLWSLDPETGRTTRVSFGIEQYVSIAASSDGRRLVATVENQDATLWRVPVLNRVATEHDASRLTLPTVLAAAPSYGEEALFYLSWRGSGDELWAHRGPATTKVWEGTRSAILEPPAVSPDGRFVGLVVLEGADPVISILTADGAERRNLEMDGVTVRGSITWSPDGQWIAAGASKGGQPGLFRFAVDGGPPIRVSDGECVGPDWSPAGDLIIYAGPQIEKTTPLLAVRPDGTPVDLPSIGLLRERRGKRAHFLPDGRGIIYMQGESPMQDFFLLDLDTLESRRLTRFEDPSEMRTFDITPDGSAIVYDRLRRHSDLVLIELPGPPSH